MVDFGYIHLALTPSWMARFDREFNLASLHSLEGTAFATLRMYSAGTDDVTGKFEEFYNLLALQHQLHGLHFDDLGEDLDYEMLVESLTPDGNSLFQHIFLRLCSDIIVRVELRDYLPEDEESMRLMLVSLQRGDFANRASEFAQIGIPIEQLNWDWAGEIAISMGGK